ncbi:MAG: ribosomal L7Ae/L30e/S12e/Gadd45 family protein, partial [Nanoarchaeota archaeon]
MAITVSQLNEIKKLLDTGKLTFGATEALKLLRAGKAAKIWLSMNVKQDLLDDIKHHAKLAGVDVLELPQSNEEL